MQQPPQPPQQQPMYAQPETMTTYPQAQVPPQQAYPQGHATSQQTYPQAHAQPPQQPHQPLQPPSAQQHQPLPPKAQPETAPGYQPHSDATWWEETSTPHHEYGPPPQAMTPTTTDQKGGPYHHHDHDHEAHATTWNKVARIICAILLPPLGVFLQTGCDKNFAINVLLTILGYIPGILHALFVILTSHEEY